MMSNLVPRGFLIRFFAQAEPTRVSSSLLDSSFKAAMIKGKRIN